MIIILSKIAFYFLLLSFIHVLLLAFELISMFIAVLTVLSVTDSTRRQSLPVGDGTLYFFRILVQIVYSFH